MVSLAGLLRDVREDNTLGGCAAKHTIFFGIILVVFLTVSQVIYAGREAQLKELELRVRAVEQATYRTEENISFIRADVTDIKRDIRDAIRK